MLGMSTLSERSYISCLKPLIALRHLHGDLLPFYQGFTTGTVDCTVMHKHIFTLALLDKAVSLFLVKPL